MNFMSGEFLISQIRNIMGFYDSRCIDSTGGFYHCYMNNGDVFDTETRTLVASCRFIINYCHMYRLFNEEHDRERILHGLAFLRERHLNPANKGYTWRLVGHQRVDNTNHCYGLAFVLLAYARAAQCHIPLAKQWMEETWALMEQHFWLDSEGKYASEADEHWLLSNYRGQNDNMHACEALIACYEASNESHYLERAIQLAESFTVQLAQRLGGQIWEHYHSDWSLDMEYAKGEKENNIRPWGIQTGHQTEWAKLLMILSRHTERDWFLPTAEALFNTAVEKGWDSEFGGLIYGYEPGGEPYDTDKYFWVQAESLAAAALLAKRTQKAHYWQWYDALWRYAWQHFVDHQYGAWFRILQADNSHYDQRKSYNNKVDYHTLGACVEVLNIL